MDMMLQNDLVTGAGELWEQGTTAEFLRAIGAGVLPTEAFHRWLVQDYLFAKGLMGFQSIMNAKAAREDQSVLVGGLSALDAELAWFEEHSASRGLDLDSPQDPVCRRYVDYLLRVAYTEEMDVLAPVLFGVEAAYLAAWSGLDPTGPYGEFIRRWSSPQFGEYVESLSKLSARHAGPRAQDHFNEVLALEGDFWQMTWEG